MQPLLLVGIGAVAFRKDLEYLHHFLAGLGKQWQQDGSNSDNSSCYELFDPFYSMCLQKEMSKVQMQKAKPKMLAIL